MLRTFLIITMVFLIGAAPASAQDLDLCQDSGCDGWVFFGAIAGTAALAVDTVLIAEAIDKAGQGHGLYQSGASFEIFWGLSHMAAGVAIAAHATQDDLGLIGLGLPIALVGAYFVVHGAFSLGSARPPPPPEDEPEEAAGEATDEAADEATDEATDEASEGEELEEGDAPDDDAPAEDDAPATEPIEPAAAVSLAPLPGGAMVQVFGTF